MSVIDLSKNTIPYMTIATGRHQDLTSAHVFGYIDNVTSSSVPESITPQGGLYPFPETASQISLVSTDSDTMTVTIRGLDANYNLASESVTLNGITPVSTTGYYIRVYGISTDVINAGVITASISSDVLAQIAVGDSNSLLAVHTIPRGYTGYLVGVDVSVNKGHDAMVSMYVRASNDNFKIQFTSDIYESAYSYRPVTPIKLPEVTDIDFRVTGVENSGTRVACGFELVLDKCLNY